MSEIKRSRKPLIVIGIIGVAILGAVLFSVIDPPDSPRAPEPPSEAGAPDQVEAHTTTLTMPIKPQAVLDYNELGADNATSALIDQRKQEYGIGDGVDLIAEPGESIKVGRFEVSMTDILEQIKLQKEELIESDLGESSTGSPGSYGIYVVQRGDNIWNIHFKFLQNYLTHRDIDISPIADEPNKRGFSSGVGKLLKFSEKMVHIYSIRERKLDVDLDIIVPNSKLVVYNMTDVFALLDQIDYSVVNRLEFDGENIWIPAEQD
ncbi:MAG: hypothetical protein HKM93_10290 [Desulfobacteraceae bacterium]|nr:hypothetical protein [Desulfobacteraceae bacterium]